MRLEKEKYTAPEVEVILTLDDVVKTSAAGAAGDAFEFDVFYDDWQ